jgi:hypothetical protein
MPRPATDIDNSDRGGFAIDHGRRGDAEMTDGEKHAHRLDTVAEARSASSS